MQAQTRPIEPDPGLRGGPVVAHLLPALLAMPLQSGSLLWLAVVFVVLAVVAGVAGFGGIAGMSMEAARILVIVFLILAVLSFLL